MPTYTAEENATFKTLYDKADAESLGVLTGDKAVEFFAKANLPVSTLGEIWQIADEENNGFLTLERFKVALRLIGHAQQGEGVSRELIEKAGPLPKLQGISTGAHIPTPKSVAIPKITVEDKTKFLRMFMSAGPSNGMLEGEKARDIFMKSNLPVVQLGAIWNLADTKNRGSLDATDFNIGMHFIQLAMEGNLPSSGVPQSLPSGLYESAIVGNTSTAGASPRVGTPTKGMSGILKPQSTGERPITKQHTGPKVAFSGFGPETPTGLPASPSAGSAFFRAPANATQNQQWDIQPPEKARADTFFDSLDPNRRGYIEGEQAVPFFMESKLPETTLATIWDLSDIRSEGRLTKDSFAVAMRLINDQLDGKQLPNSLPTSLIPPSLRQSAQQQPQSAFRQPQAPTPQQDLFSLMDEPEETPEPAQSFNAAPLSPQSTANSMKRPPSVTGQSMTLSPQNTGRGLQTQTPPQSKQTQQFASRTGGMEDFLGDSSDKVSNDAIQLGQTRNELNASQRGVSTLQSQRRELEASAAAVQQEIEELKEKLTASRATFESEQKIVNDLSIRAGDHKKEAQKAREELIRAESDLSALKDEKREWEGSVLRDKEEIRSLKAKLAEHAKETASLKAEVEKLKKEGRQQKGMLAISKKQVSTSEGEQERLRSEAQELRQPAPLTIENLDAAAVALPRSTIASPTGSVRSTNPFDRFMQRAFTPDTATPQAATPITETTQPTRAFTPEATPSAPVQSTITEADPFSAEPDPFSQPHTSSSAIPANASFDDDFEAAMSVPPVQANSHAANLDGEFDDLDDHTLPSGAPAHDLHLPVQTGTAHAVPESQESLTESSPELGQDTPRTNIDTESSDDEDHGPEQPTGYRQSSSSDAAEPPARNGGLKSDFQTKRASMTSSVDHFEDAQAVPSPTSSLPPGYANLPLGGPVAEEAPRSMTPVQTASAPVQPPISAAAAKPSAVDDFDDFEKEFVNLSPTTAIPPVTNAGTSQHAVSSSFDDDFGMDDFSSAFSPPKSGATSQAAAPDSSFDDAFDDAFAPSNAAKAVPSSGNAQTTTRAPPATTPAASDDIAAVKTLCSMGFSRTAAIDALEAHDYNVDRALNTLLAKA